MQRALNWHRRAPGAETVCFLHRQLSVSEIENFHAQTRFELELRAHLFSLLSRLKGSRLRNPGASNQVQLSSEICHEIVDNIFKTFQCVLPGFTFGL